MFKMYYQNREANTEALENPKIIEVCFDSSNMVTSNYLIKFKVNDQTIRLLLCIANVCVSIYLIVLIIL